MKKNEKFIYTTILYIFSLLSATICIIFSTKVYKIFKLLQIEALSDGGTYQYPAIYILGFIFSILMVIVCLTALIIHCTDLKNKHIIQTALFYTMLALFIISSLPLIVIYFNFLDYFCIDTYDLLVEYNKEIHLYESIFLEKAFIWLFIEGISTTIFCAITKKQAFTPNINETTIKKEENNNNFTQISTI